MSSRRLGSEADKRAPSRLTVGLVGPTWLRESMRMSPFERSTSWHSLKPSSTATLSCQPLRHDAFSTTGSGQMLSSFSCSSVKKRSGPLLLVVSFQVEALSSESQTPVTRWCGLLLSVLPCPQKSSRPRCGPCRSCSPPPPAPREDAHKQPRTDDNKRPTHDVKENGT